LTTHLGDGSSGSSREDNSKKKKGFFLFFSPQNILRGREGHISSVWVKRKRAPRWFKTPPFLGPHPTGGGEKEG